MLAYAFVSACHEVLEHASPCRSILFRPILSRCGVLALPMEEFVVNTVPFSHVKQPREVHSHWHFSVSTWGTDMLAKFQV